MTKAIAMQHATSEPTNLIRHRVSYRKNGKSDTKACQDIPVTTAERPYRGVSADDRRAERREQLLSACLDVVGRDGVAASTVQAICDQAGLTKRYFYEAFTDRDAILCAALDSLHTSLLAQVRGAIDGVEGSRERTRITIALLVDAMDDPRMARLYVEAVALPALQAVRREAYDVYAELVTREVLGIRKPSAQARLNAHAVVAGITEAVARWIEGGTGLTRVQLIDVLTELGTRPERA